jgi:type II secretion system protein H
MAGSEATMTFPTGHKSADPTGRGGFTLIELLVVMAMLLIVLGVSFPSLKHFFHARNLDSEARRLLSLTRYGQSRAVAEGIPMVLWIDAQARTYGLQASTGYVEEDTRAVEFVLEEDMNVEVTLPAVTPTSTMARSQMASGTGRHLPMIHFSPDGFISEPSPEAIKLRQGENDVVWIVPSGHRLNYEIQVNYWPNARH